MKIMYVLMILAASVGVRLNAQPGYLDNSFNGTGTVVFDNSGNWCRGTDVAVRPDGKIWVLGYTYNTDHYDILLIRYNTDGSLDNTFYTDGVETISAGTTDTYGYALHLYANGDLLIGGSADESYLLMKVDGDGNFIPSFGDGGEVLITNFWDVPGHVTDLGVQSDGTIVFTATGLAAAIGSVAPDGTVLSSNDYLVGASPGTELDGVLVLPDDRVMATGIEYASGQTPPFGHHYVLVMRFNSDLSGDLSFGNLEFGINFFAGAQVVYPDGGPNPSYAFGRDLALATDGKLLIGGAYYSAYNNADADRFQLMKLNDDGGLETGFNLGAADSSSFIGDHIEKVAVLPDGKIIAAGVDPAHHCTVARYDSDGTPDNTFGANNGWTAVALSNTLNLVGGMDLMPDGRIVVAGSTYTPGSQVAIARFNNEPLVVEELAGGEDDVKVYPNPGTGTFTITLPRAAQEITIDDPCGREVDRRSVNRETSLQESIHRPGAYVVRVKTATGVIVRSVVVI